MKDNFMVQLAASPESGRRAARPRKFHQRSTYVIGFAAEPDRILHGSNLHVILF